MIDWIDEKCKSWGPTHREILFGTRQEGWPRRSVLGRIKEEWEGSGQRSRVVQIFPEVYLGPALEVQRAIREPFPMDYEPYATLVVRYCIQSQDQKHEQLGYLLDRRISTSEYWRCVDRSHYYLAARIRVVGTTGKVVGTNSAHSC